LRQCCQIPARHPLGSAGERVLGVTPIKHQKAHARFISLLDATYKCKFQEAYLGLRFSMTRHQYNALI
jgi:hypothetical protein